MCTVVVGAMQRELWVPWLGTVGKETGGAQRLGVCGGDGRWGRWSTAVAGNARSRASFWMKLKGEWTLWYENDVGHWVRRGPRGPCSLRDAIKWAQRPEEAVRGLGALLGSKWSL